MEVRDEATQELLQEAFGENMVLDRIYTRLLQFNTYFVNIVFGSGNGRWQRTEQRCSTELGIRQPMTLS